MTNNFQILSVGIITFLVISSSIQVFNNRKNLNEIAAFSLAEQINSNVKNPIEIHEIETKKVHVGDIEMAYKMFGKGSPILLINGFSAPLDFWDPTLLEKLASNYTVVTFDNRGIGNTTLGDKEFTMKQFANDTAGLMDALKIKKADVIGWSMGGMIAQELVLGHPDKVGKLVIYASICGGKESTLPSKEVMNAFAGNFNTQSERLQRFLPLMFPEKWRIQNPDYLQNLPPTTEMTPEMTLSRQTDAIINWPGTCNQLGKITQQTLVIVGTDDILTVPSNSLLITGKIPGAVLVQIQGGGHAVMMQYPEKFSNTVLSFLNTRIE